MRLQGFSLARGRGVRVIRGRQVGYFLFFRRFKGSQVPPVGAQLVEPWVFYFLL
jgi:hypothetical protein